MTPNPIRNSGYATFPVGTGVYFAWAGDFATGTVCEPPRDPGQNVFVRLMSRGPGGYGEWTICFQPNLLERLPT